METLEFIMRTDLSSAVPAVLDFNFEEMKSALAASLELYKGLVVTEDAIKPAKQDRADLNKLRDAIEAKRKDVKKACMAPYNDFEAKVKELVALIDAPIAAIDGQLKAYEDNRRADKRAEVLAIYEETVGDLRAVLPFEKLWRDEWYNTGVSLKKIREAIMAMLMKTAADLDVLSTVESEFSEAVKLKYLEALDLNAALTERARLQEQAKRLREYEDELRARRASIMPEVERVAARNMNVQAAAPAEEMGVPIETETVYLLRVECQVTMSQAAELSKWLKDRNISYRRV